MRLTKAVVKQFEADQQKHGTHTALHNIIWLVAESILKGIGVKRPRTERGKK
jgi:hypothetical protein